MIVAIHQPNFFPWLGYFDKIARADVFILMDNVQFPKTGGTWLNRVQVLVQGQPAWVTMPIVRAYHGVRCVCEMRINNAFAWREKLLRTLSVNYGRAPFFEDVYPFLEKLINYSTDSLVAYNLNAIQALSREFGLGASKFLLGSSLFVNGQATDLLIAMVKAVGGSAYLAGGGAGGYQEDEKFALAGLELMYQKFDHPTYPQFRSEKFVAGLSIIDVLMNCGFDQTRTLIMRKQNAVKKI